MRPFASVSILPDVPFPYAFLFFNKFFKTSGTFGNYVL